MEDWIGTGIGRKGRTLEDRRMYGMYQCSNVRKRIYEKERGIFAAMYLLFEVESFATFRARVRFDVAVYVDVARYLSADLGCNQKKQALVPHTSN